MASEIIPGRGLEAIAEYPATPDNFIYMCRNAL